jgi:hypothetical protein
MKQARQDVESQRAPAFLPLIGLAYQTVPNA